MSTTITLLQGRLGNQLFIYAFARAISLASGSKCVLSEAPLKAKHITNRLDCFVLSPDVQFVPEHHLSFLQKLGLSLYARLQSSNKRMARFSLELKYKKLFSRMGLFLCEDGYIQPPTAEEYAKRDMLNIGYVQSEKYFLPYRDQILSELTFRPEIMASCKALADEITGAIEPTCLHVRLGDYVKNPLHGVADAVYYHRALAHLKELKPNATIFVFSDNIDLVRHELNLDASVHYIPSDVDELQTMYLGSLCHNFVISNSSFSWWMQYLSRRDDRLVLAPSRWYARPCPCDIYQDFWTIEEV